MSLQDNPFASGPGGAAMGSEAWADARDLEVMKSSRLNRFLGAFIDGLLPAFVAAPVVVTLVAVVGEQPDPDALQAAGYLAYFVGMLPPMLLNWYLIVTRGQTLGKMVAGTRIVTEQGGPVDFMTGVVLRNWVIGMVNAFCGFASLVDALLIFGERRQCGHDLIAKTIVVNASAWNPYGR